MSDVDCMQVPVLRKVVEHLWADQGLSLSELPKAYVIHEEGSNEVTLAVRWLRTLNEEELETFCVGDQDEEMRPMIEQATDRVGAEAAHHVLDAIFMGIGA